MVIPWAKFTVTGYTVAKFTVNGYTVAKFTVTGYTVAKCTVTGYTMAKLTQSLVIPWPEGEERVEKWGTLPTGNSV